MKKKIKQVELPMEFNPMLNKFEPVLPTRKKSLKIERKRNWWAFWYLIISIIILILTLIWAFN
jgi:hypothetical protein